MAQIAKMQLFGHPIYFILKPKILVHKESLQYLGDKKGKDLQFSIFILPHNEQANFAFIEFCLLQHQHHTEL